jgi:hypothetical protein
MCRKINPEGTTEIVGQAARIARRGCEESGSGWKGSPLLWSVLAKMTAIHFVISNTKLQNGQLDPDIRNRAHPGRRTRSTHGGT